MCLFIDNLFDSANGNIIKPTPGKELCSAVTAKSLHWEFWDKAIIILQSMKYETRRNIPSVTNWIRTIKGLQLICKRLLKAGFKYIFLRNFNQDPIENFFGSIRSHGIRNTNPTPNNFISSFKALLINNFTSCHSVGANCEDDDCDGVLDNLRDFLFNEIPLETIEDNYTNEPTSPGTIMINNYNIITMGSRAYISGWVIKKVKKVTKSCPICISKLASIKLLNEHFVIKDRQYLECNLIYPNKNVIDLYSYIIYIFNLNFHRFVYKQNAFNNFYTFILKTIPIGNLICPNHDLYNIFVKESCKLLIYSYVNNINRILSKGEKTKHTIDPIKLSAITYHNKYSKKKKVLQRQNVNCI